MEAVILSCDRLIEFDLQTVKGSITVYGGITVFPQHAETCSLEISDALVNIRKLYPWFDLSYSQVSEKTEFLCIHFKISLSCPHYVKCNL